MIKRQFFQVGFFFLIFLLVSFRFIDAYLYPNFYAEDGAIFIKNIYDLGFFKAAATPFNGYLVLGLYLIAAIPVGIAQFFHLSFFQVPLLLAITVNLFFALVFWSSQILFLKFSRPLRMGLCLMLVYIPMSPYQYEIFAVVGNLKFLFIYAGTLLMLYRFEVRRFSDKRVVITDGLLALLALSNPLCLLNAFIAGLHELWCAVKEKRLRLTNTLSLSVAAVAGLVQIYVGYTHPVKIVGYLDGPLVRERLVEALIARPLFYHFSPFTYNWMNDAIVITLLVAGALAFAIYNHRQKTYKAAFTFALVMGLAFLTNLAFVLGRPGITEHFSGYVDGSYSRFFYTHNLIVLLGLFYWLFQTEKKRAFKILSLILAIQFIIFDRVKSPPHFMARQVGPLSRSKTLCTASGAPEELIVLPIYPQTNATMSLPRSIVCD